MYTQTRPRFILSSVRVELAFSEQQGSSPLLLLRCLPRNMGVTIFVRILCVCSRLAAVEVFTCQLQVVILTGEGLGKTYVKEPTQRKENGNKENQKAQK